jgi:hypothetical protein
MDACAFAQLDQTYHVKTMTPAYYNIEVAYSLDAHGWMDSELAHYARGYAAQWSASDFSQRSGKRCNCYSFPFTDEGAQAARRFITDLPSEFSIDEAGICKGGKFMLIFPYPRKNMKGNAVYEALNASHPIRQFIGSCLHSLGV